MEHRASGGQRLDIGPALMMNDPQAGHHVGSFAGGPYRRVEARYEEGMGTTVGDIGRYRALSGIGSEVISGLKRRRPHWQAARPEWERIANVGAVPVRRARDLLKGAT